MVELREVEADRPQNCVGPAEKSLLACRCMAALETSPLEALESRAITLKFCLTFAFLRVGSMFAHMHVSQQRDLLCFDNFQSTDIFYYFSSFKPDINCGNNQVYERE